MEEDVAKQRLRFPHFHPADEKVGTGVRYLIQNTKPTGKCPI